VVEPVTPFKYDPTVHKHQQSKKQSTTIHIYTINVLQSECMNTNYGTTN